MGMDMNVNTILTAAVGLMGVLGAGTAYAVRSKQKDSEYIVEYGTIEEVLEKVKEEIIEDINEEIDGGLSVEEYNKEYKRKSAKLLALDNAVYGEMKAKEIVKGMIYDIIERELNNEQVERLLGLDEGGEPNKQIMFEILMYKYKQRYGRDALLEWVKEYNLDKEKKAPNGTRESDVSYYITIEELENSYIDKNYELSEKEKRDILVVVIYQLYKGFGIFDTLNEMNCNGFNLGTSGSLMRITKEKKGITKDSTDTNAVWLHSNGKYIHLRFMDYKSPNELMRIVQLMSRWGSPGAFTAKRGYIVNTMEDQSRFTAIRPPAAECVMAFVRKFRLDNLNLETLVLKPYAKRGMLAVMLLEYIVRAELNSVITGEQGSGKTTLISALAAYINTRYNIRVLEMAPELYLRELLHGRNIASVRETVTCALTTLMDILKKTDAQATLIGEVASDELVGRAIHGCLVGSNLMIFSYHGKGPDDTMKSLRNSLAKVEGFDQMHLAEKQVVDAIRVIVNVVKEPNGKRYVSDIYEIEPLNSDLNYEEYNSEAEREEKEDIMNRNKLKYYKNVTDMRLYKVRTLLHYNNVTDEYEAKERFSKVTEKKIRETMDAPIVKEYDALMEMYWGDRDDSEEIENEGGGVKVDVTEEMRIVVRKKVEDTRLDESLNVKDIEDAIDEIEVAAELQAKMKLADEFTMGLFEV